MATVDSGVAKGSAVTGVIAIVFACFMAVATYNFLELNVIILTTFKKRNGLYFWSFIAATWGILLHGLGFTLKYFQFTTNGFVYGTISLLGWYAMVTGQSVVLYSRLHIILNNRTRLRAVLIVIIVDAIVCHIPMTVMYYGANSDNPNQYLSAFSVYEKVQVTIFFLQELMISGLYIHATASFLRNSVLARGNTDHNMLKHLICVNIIVILLDAPILALEYSNLFDIQTSYKTFAYSLKLKLEFSILNRLLDVARFRTGAYIMHSGRDGNVSAQTITKTAERRDEAHVGGRGGSEFELHSRHNARSAKLDTGSGDGRKSLIDGVAVTGGVQMDCRVAT